MIQVGVGVAILIISLASASGGSYTKSYYGQRKFKNRERNGSKYYEVKSPESSSHGYIDERHKEELGSFQINESSSSSSYKSASSKDEGKSLSDSNFSLESNEEASSCELDDPRSFQSSNERILHKKLTAATGSSSNAFFDAARSENEQKKGLKPKNHRQRWADMIPSEPILHNDNGKVEGPILEPEIICKWVKKESNIKKSHPKEVLEPIIETAYLSEEHDSASSNSSSLGEWLEIEDKGQVVDEREDTENGMWLRVSKDVKTVLTKNKKNKSKGRKGGRSRKLSPERPLSVLYDRLKEQAEIKNDPQRTNYGQDYRDPGEKNSSFPLVTQTSRLMTVEQFIEDEESFSDKNSKSPTPRKAEQTPSPKSKVLVSSPRVYGDANMSTRKFFESLWVPLSDVKNEE